jgi:hypothetical protein
MTLTKNLFIIDIIVMTFDTRANEGDDDKPGLYKLDQHEVEQDCHELVTSVYAI